MRVLFISTGLATGGAEKQLARLLGSLVDEGVLVAVAALRGGPVAGEIRACGVPVQVHELSVFRDLPRVLRALADTARAFRPDIVQGWMYHGNVAASLLRRWVAPKAKLAWSVRQSLYDLAREKLLTRQVIRISAGMSSGAQAIVYNSYSARTQHEAAGFAATSGRVIDNGFDPDQFRPDPAARRAVRDMLGLAEQTPLIGLFARYHPMKGHDVFLRAAALMAKQRPDVHFIFAGHGVSADNSRLAAALSSPALAGRVHCLGERRDIPVLTAALDIASSSSWGEAFPNALAEAMSCGVPVVATDVGDVRRIVGEAGIVVPVGDADSHARAWQALLANPGRRQAMGKAGRERVSMKFSVATMVARYLALYEELLRE